MTTLLERRRVMAKRGSAIDWETIARGMLDNTTPFAIPDGVGLANANSWIFNRTNLVSIVIPSTMTEIGNSYCAYCTNLLSVTIGENITNIGSGAFRDCPRLQEMIFNGTTPPTLAMASGANASLGSTAYTFPIYVPDSAVNDYKAAASWVNYASRVKGISERP